MEKMFLGKTGLQVTRTSFGALPIQRTELPEAIKILRKAYDSGINFFDTARVYSDSEEKIAKALSGLRHNIILATKSKAKDGVAFKADLETSLNTLHTDYIDIMQFHFSEQVYRPDDGTGLYEAMLEARQQGKVRFMGITSHRIGVAWEASESGLYDTVQFPFSSLSIGQEALLPDNCQKHGVGFIAMKSLAGGLIRHIPSAFAFLRRQGNAVPIWGIQHMSELEEFLGLEANPPQWNEELQKTLERDRQELSGDFCRCCGYCLPCPAEIDLPQIARLGLSLSRMPWQQFLTEQWQEKVHKVSDCLECGACKTRCPYELDTPELIKKNAVIYEDFLRAKGIS